MIRRILLPLDPSPYSRSSMQYAVHIAKRQHSEIEGLTVIDFPDIEDRVITFVPLPQGTEYNIEHENEMIADVRKKNHDVLVRFSEICQSEHLFCTQRQYEGKPENVILNESKFFDLVIIGMRTYFHFKTTDQPGHSLEKILNHTITPILAVPEKFKPIRKVLIAYDGSMPSARALQRFVHMSVNSEYEITLLMSHDDRNYAMTEMQKASEYIHCYGNIPVTFSWTDKNLIKTIEKNFLSNTDVVVCGMHSKNLLEKFTVGSLPKYLIEQNKTAAFICQ
ncbi:MAG: universal stress protein [Candidatus Ratteibacteria bacterium]